MAETIDAELEREGKIQHVKVIGDVVTDTVESGTIVIRHRIGNLHGFAPGQQPVANGEYLITCIVHGERQKPERVRVEWPHLRGGWISRK